VPEIGVAAAGRNDVPAFRPQPLDDRGAQAACPAGDESALVRAT
jgi:hypothetical protein